MHDYKRSSPELHFPLSLTATTVYSPFPQGAFFLPDFLVRIGAVAPLKRVIGRQMYAVLCPTLARNIKLCTTDVRRR